MSEGGYIQGAGDDSEGWSYGLTPPVFWANKSILFRTSEEDLPDLIEDLVKEHRSQGTGQEATRIAPTRNLYICQTGPTINDSGLYDLVIDCSGDPAASEENPKRLNLGCRHSKLGSRDLRESLDKVKEFVSSQLASNPSRSLLVTCESGKDLSGGALLAILCLFYTEEGNFIPIYFPNYANNLQESSPHLRRNGSTSNSSGSVLLGSLHQNMMSILRAPHSNPSTPL